MNELAKIESFRKELAIAETIEEISILDTSAEAYALFLKKNKISLDKQNEIGSFRVEIETKKAEWLNEHFPHGATEDSPRNAKVKIPKENLKKMPVPLKESADARLIAREPEDVSEAMEEIINNDEVITPKKVAGMVRKKQRKKETDDLKRNPVPMPDGVFNVIYADPPWKYNDEQDTEKLGGAMKHYPLMTIQELCDMKLPNIDKNAVLFLWVTSPLLEESFEVIRAWGFKYKTSFVWDKVRHNMGHYNSVRHEFLLVCTRGSFTPQNVKLYDSVQEIEKTKHSEKPKEFRDIIECLYPNGSKIELFARGENKGWEPYGNEII